MKGTPDTDRKAKASGFWKLISRAAEASLMKRPPFSGSWLLDRDPENIEDPRENLYVRTELHVPEGGSERIYSISPKEFSLSKHDLQRISRSISDLGSTPPGSSIMEDEKRLRRYVERRVMRALSSGREGSNEGDLQVLSRISGQYTVGFGILEHLLRDERVQDIYVEPPFASSPVHLTIGGMKRPELDGPYSTNIILDQSEVSRMISILRFTSGRPFSEADPVLECDMPQFNARVTAVSPPLSPGGISLAIRKHSHDPWTLLRLIGSGSLDAYSSAFLDLCIDGRSTMMIAGPRGAGKSSLLGALLFDVDPSTRIITIEDTPELPLEQLTSEGYNVLGLTVEGDGKASADKALRTALRLGESVLVMGEVRGPETKTLYEAMSAGTAGSAVLGTFHADSSISVYKRAVEDLGVSPGSFSATDIVVVCGLVQPMGLRTRYRKVVQISEYIKIGPHGRFRDLFLYDPKKGSLAPTSDLPDSDTVRRISSLWGISRRELMDDVDLRRRIMEYALDVLDPTEISRPSSMVRVLNTLRETKELSSDGTRGSLFKEWKKRFVRGEEWVE